MRPIRQEEIDLIVFMLQQAGLNPADYPFPQVVDEYEGGKMGSIGMASPEAIYDGDIFQVEYVDTDGTQVVITLTKDTNNQLLDLDFWKVDFSKLLLYPTPKTVLVAKK